MTAKIISIVNQKGGVGKTTSAINIATGFSLFHNKKVLLIDLDPQGNCTTGIGYSGNYDATIYQVIIGQVSIKSTISKTQINNLDLIPSNLDLSAAESDLKELFARESKLKKALEPIINNYDIIIIDCPPSLNLLTINSLNASNFYIVPLQAEFYSVAGFLHLERIIENVKEFLNPTIENGGVFITMYDKRNNLHKSIREQLIKNIDNLKDIYIPRNIKLAEASSNGQDIFSYDKHSTGYTAYKMLVNELFTSLFNRDGEHNE